MKTGKTMSTNIRSDDCNENCCQTTDTVLMIEPVAFGYNSETAVNNFFQQKPDIPLKEIQEKALKEFKGMEQMLKNKGINVIVVKDTTEPCTPDSIFPNNWISFHKDHRVAIYPLFAVNRRFERRMEIVQHVKENGFDISQMVDYSVYEKESRFLEGTGSMVLDRVNHIAYATISPRTDAELFKWFCNDFGFRPVLFKAFQNVNGGKQPVYHTNIVLSVAEKYVVVCLDCIYEKRERLKLEKLFWETGKEVIEISEDQMHKFAGNVLQVRNINGDRFLVISQTAYNHLNEIQKEKLNSFNELIITSVPTIEKYGGGGVRCMMTEIF